MMPPIRRGGKPLGIVHGTEVTTDRPEPAFEAAAVSPTGLPFGYLASSLAQLLEVARHELEHDREAAKASLATASTI
jgi:hypothetical protein